MSIIHVLRQPAAPNAYYHAACYAPGEIEIVCVVLRLRDDQRCADCGVLISAGLYNDEQGDQCTELRQLTLF